MKKSRIIHGDWLNQTVGMGRCLIILSSTDVFSFEEASQGLGWSVANSSSSIYATEHNLLVGLAGRGSKAALLENPISGEVACVSF